jgi:hypothetical protein
MTTTDDYDSPWKDALENYLEEFLNVRTLERWNVRTF